jgi:hypothetical protein
MGAEIHIGMQKDKPILSIHKKIHGEDWRCGVYLPYLDIITKHLEPDSDFIQACIRSVENLEAKQGARNETVSEKKI